jgi:hypothetical protein
MKKLLQIIRIEQYDRGRRLQCLKVNITLRKVKLPACRKYLQQQLGEICLTIREVLVEYEVPQLQRTDTKGD